MTQQRTLPAYRADRLSGVISLSVGAVGLAASIYAVAKATAAGEDSWYPMSRALDFVQRTPIGQLYQALFFSEHVKFQYPPSGLLLLDLLRRLGLGASVDLNRINALLLIAAGLTFAAFAVQILGPVRWRGHRLPVGAIAFLAALTVYPNRLALQFGQIQVLLGLLFLMSCLALEQGKSLWAGCLIAGAATIKPQFLLLGVFMLWRRDWRFVGGFVAVAAAGALLSICIYGWQNQLDYLRVLSFLSQHGEYHHLNQSINGIFNRYLYDGPSVDVDPDNPIPNSGFPPYIPTVYAATTLTSLVLVASAFLVRRSEPDRLLNLAGFCLGAILFTMASPIAWVHHYNILLPAYVVALKLGYERGPGKQRRLQMALVLVSIALTSIPLVAPFGPTRPDLNLLQTHVFFGALLLVALLLNELAPRLKFGAPRPGVLT
jgi:hypothetical protein